MWSFLLLKLILRENSRSLHVNVVFIAPPPWNGGAYWTPHTVFAPVGLHSNRGLLMRATANDVSARALPWKLLPGWRSRET